MKEVSENSTLTGHSESKISLSKYMKYYKDKVVKEQILPRETKPKQLRRTMIVQALMRLDTDIKAR